MGTIWFCLYFLFLSIFNFGYIVGYSVFSELGAHGWVFACFFAFAAIARLQISFTFPVDFAKKERKVFFWVGLLFCILATLEYLFHYRQSIQYQFSIHSYGSTYSSLYIPGIGLFAYVFSVIVGIRRVIDRYFDAKKSRNLTFIKSIFDDRENRITIALTLVTVAELLLTAFYFLGFLKYFSTPILAEVMNLGILVIFSMYALIYTGSTVGRTGFIPRLVGLGLVFILFFSTLTSRYYEGQLLAQFKSQLTSEFFQHPNQKLKKEDFLKYDTGKQSQFYFDGDFYFVEIESKRLFGVIDQKSDLVLLYDYLIYREYIHKLLIPAFFIQLISVFLVLLLFPIFFKISFIFPLNQLIHDLESEFLNNKKKATATFEDESFEFSSLKNAFFRMGSMIRLAKKELREVSQPLEVLETFLNESPKEIQIAGQTLIYKSAAFERTIEEVYKASRYPHPVIITGETGAGKELVAKLIHHASEKKDGPFLAVNCATLPETLWESEIFGSKKGSFTDSKSDRKGRIEEAENGSLFFDEIGEMPIFIQAKMLRLLQENKFSPIGSNLEQNANCRFIFATNQNLESLVQKKLFREDLLYRIKVFQIHLIPLRERIEDIPYLLRFFINRFTAQFKLLEPKISTAAMQRIMSYSWPGNIRELENFVTRLMSHISKEIVDENDILPFLSKEVITNKPELSIDSTLGSLEEEIKALSRLRIRQALHEANGNVTRAAELLQLKRTTLRYKMLELGMKEKS